MLLGFRKFVFLVPIKRVNVFGLGHHESLEAKLYIIHEMQGTHVLVTGVCN